MCANSNSGGTLDYSDTGTLWGYDTEMFNKRIQSGILLESSKLATDILFIYC